ncbi:MAG: hypothetical protein AAF687_03395 [Pseudomonadota bacterium]
MKRLNLALAGLAAFILTACGAPQDPAQAKAEPAAKADNPAPAPDAPVLGLMTSLPLYWPLGADFADLASGDAERPWQRVAIERRYRIEPLDTLSPIAALDADQPATDPLASLERLAVIQPRGLTPSDNVALDNWVRAGGHLLLVLDPMLTGEYEAPLGDPRRPIDAALIPPVVKRWGMEITFNDMQGGDFGELPLNAGYIWLAQSGVIKREQTPETSCDLSLGDVIAQCRVGKGRVTLLADAASFEHTLDEFENARTKEPPLLNVLDFAFFTGLEGDIPMPESPAQ